jgi:hypothetical protein
MASENVFNRTHCSTGMLLPPIHAARSSLPPQFRMLQRKKRPFLTEKMLLALTNVRSDERAACSMRPSTMKKDRI